MSYFRRAWVLPLIAVRAFPASSENPIVLVADSRRFTGWEAWWANLYNESHLYFALMTVLIILALGLGMGQLTEWIMRRIGINLKSRVLAEH